MGKTEPSVKALQGAEREGRFRSGTPHTRPVALGQRPAGSSAPGNSGEGTLQVSCRDWEKSCS